MTVPMISRMTLQISMKLTGSLAADWIQPAVSCGTLPKISTQENTAAAATRNSTIAE
ncbi:hypothetical protein M2197_006383 [Bradyrhizobium japonicum]|nr:hypothetical protein [Bradyrhizobium japonicum]MCS3992866.1 hypothetical protein [Bradyrhizobium japonicum]MCS4021202.1 hypothetical protein [Bradyrhizobium japonicum]MCS4208311.1 hypothetical protein [Bradyrhizobium japonicum]